LAAGLAFGVLAWSALSPGELLAHGVYIYGWGEGDRICTDSYFSRSDKVQGGVVQIQQNGQVLVEGRTNDQGEVCFPRPQVAGDYLLVVEAGEGHRAEFNLRAVDLPALSAAPAASTDPAAAAPLGQTAPVASTDPAAAAVVSLEALKSVLQDELRTQLGPINRFLAQSREAENGPPSFREVVGGLGWVAAIFGAVFWARGRRQPKS
jgi:nickel transport protein